MSDTNDTQQHPLPSFITPERYWDLAEVGGRPESYSDFEGFYNQSDVEHVKKMRQRVLERVEEEWDVPRKFIADLAAHWVAENISEGGYKPTEEEVVTFAQNLEWVFSSRWWMKTEVSFKKEA